MRLLPSRCIDSGKWIVEIKFGGTIYLWTQKCVHKRVKRLLPKVSLWETNWAV